MDFPLWITLVYLGTAAVSFVLAGVLYRANPRRGINQAATFFALMCGVWQFATAWVYFNADTAVIYIRVLMSIYFMGMACVALMLAALRYPDETWAPLVRRTRWFWVGAVVYAAPVFSPWLIPYDSTAENPSRGVLWYPYGVLQILGGLLVLGMTLRAALILKGAARFTGQIICGASGFMFVLLGLRYLLRPWLPPTGLPLLNAVVAMAIVGAFAFAVLTRRVFQARVVLVEVLVQAAGIGLAMGAVHLVLKLGDAIGGPSNPSRYVAVLVGFMVWMAVYLGRRRQMERQAWEMGGRLVEQFEEISRRGRHTDGGVSEALDVLLEWTGARHGSILVRDGGRWVGDKLTMRVDDPLAVMLERHRWVTAESIARTWRENNAVLAGLSLDRLGGTVAVVSTRNQAGVRVLLVLGEKANGDYYSHQDVANLQLLVDALCSMVESREAGQRGRALGRIEALERLGASIGHDFKQHLVAVRLLAHRIGDRNLGEGEVGPYLRKLETELGKLGEFSRRLTKLGQPAPGPREHLAISEMFAAVRSFLEESAAKQGVRLACVTEDESLAVWVNRNRLYQALVNLGMNAIEAMAQVGGGQDDRALAFRARREQAAVTIEVSDTGPGLPAAVLDRLFDPFVTQGKPDGDGLGLYLTWDAVTREGGEIRYEANVPHGTRFVMTFPV